MTDIQQSEARLGFLESHPPQGGVQPASRKKKHIFFVCLTFLLKITSRFFSSWLSMSLCLNKTQSFVLPVNPNKKLDQ